MSAPKIIIVQESMQELKQLLKSSSLLISPRIKMLIELKKNEGCGISKRNLADLIGVNHNSIQTWRKLYQTGGISVITTHNKTGFKPTVLNKEEHQAIEKLLNDPKNGIRGYVELLNWIETKFHKEIQYNTLYKYCVREFGSSIKVARKSHVNKDPNAVDTFKKTLVKSVAKQSPKK
jgi:transposase